MSVQPRSAARAREVHRRRLGARPVWIVALTAMSAVAFGLIVYFSGTTLTFLAASPTSDPLFGDLNACLLRRLPEARSGAAVAPDGHAAAAFNGAGVAICRSSPADGVQLQWVELAGISAAAWDFKGALWLSTPAQDAQASGLWRIERGQPPTHAGDAAVVALSGHAQGVVALDASGKLVSLGSDGRALGFAELPRPPPEGVQVSVDAAGETVSVVGGGAVWLYRTSDLSALRAESPCEVEYLWWLTEPARALISCAPNESWALTLDAHTGARDAAPKLARERSVLVPQRAMYVRSCDGLLCQARAP